MPDLDVLLRSQTGYGLARKALDAMEANRVWPTALNFELWLNYVAARDTPLAQAIDQLTAASQPFTEAVGEALAAKHLTTARLNGELLTAGDALSSQLDTVSRAIESARETSEAYGEQLASASQSLDGEDAGAIRA